MRQKQEYKYEENKKINMKKTVINLSINKIINDTKTELYKQKKLIIIMVKKIINPSKTR